MSRATRRTFLRQSLSVGASVFVGVSAAERLSWGGEKQTAEIAFGLVTYQWGKDWDVPTLIRNCQTANVLGVELRTTHAHGVEPTLDANQRKEVRRQFEDSPVTLVGLGTNEAFHDPDPQVVRTAIETAKAFIKLSHDVGGSGVKVKPDDLPKNVAREKTIEQIGKALNELAAFGADYGQELRLEVHGSCSHLPTIKAIMDVATHPNARVCWNSNWTDREGEGLEYNFNLVKDRLGHTVHVRPLTGTDYPWQDLIRLLVTNHYQGWVLLEASNDPPDRVAALIEERKRFEELLAGARS